MGTSVALRSPHSRYRRSVVYSLLNEFTDMLTLAAVLWVQNFAARAVATRRYAKDITSTILRFNNRVRRHSLSQAPNWGVPGDSESYWGFSRLLQAVRYTGILRTREARFGPITDPCYWGYWVSIYCHSRSHWTPWGLRTPCASVVSGGARTNPLWRTHYTAGS